MKNKINVLDLYPVLKSLSIDNDSLKIILDFIELYKNTDNKEILNSLLSDILKN